MRKLFAVVVAIMVSAGWAGAQPLVDKVPDDAILYVGWQGSGSMPKAYEASHLKAVIDSSNVQQLVSEFLPQLMQRIGQEDRNAAGILQMVSTIGSQFWRHPTALYVGPVDLTNPERPMPSLAIYCDAGNDAAALAKQIQDIFDQAAGQSPVPMKATAEGNLVTVAVGNVPAGGAALAARQQFKDALAQVNKEPVAIVYLDIEAAVKLVDDAVDKGRDQSAKREWPKVRDVLGLQGAKRLIAAGGFDGKDWIAQSFLAAPAPRTGLLKFIDNKPLGDDVLKAIPQSATLAGAGQLDLAAIFNEIHTAVGKIDARAGTEFDNGLRDIREAIGLDLQKDILEPLGPVWGYYTDPMTGGNGMLGVVIINRLKDPTAAEKSLGRLEEVANAALRQALRRERMSLRFDQQKIGDITVHYLAAPMLTPAWAVKDGNLYFSLYPQITATAAQQASAGKSILDNESFQALRKRLGVENASGIGFADLPKTTPQTYASWLLVSRYVGFADLFGVKSPAMMLPPLPKLMEHLAPAGQATWTDEAGWHSKSVSPFPGSEALATDPVSYMAAQAPLMISILLPSLNRARETANRVKCASNLRQIGQGMLLYANENKNKYPDDLGQILLTQELNIEAFVCPSSDSFIPADVRRGKPEDMAKWVNEHNNYVYLGKGKTSATGPEVITCYERFDDHAEDGINMLFGDGHVEFVGMEAAKKMVDEQTKKQD